MQSYSVFIKEVFLSFTRVTEIVLKNTNVDPKLLKKTLLSK